MSDELKVLSVEDIEAYINGEYLKDSYEVTASKALDYCRLLIGLYRQTSRLATELKANANAARERAANTTHEFVAMRQRAEAAEASSAAWQADRDRLTTTISQLREMLSSVDEYGEFMRHAPPGPYLFSVWLARR